MVSPVIDIHIPAYNEERYIETALATLAQQTYPHFQATIHDNASTDRTPEICRAFAERDSRFQLVINSRNIGRELNTLRCLNFIEHEYFMLRSANDAMAPECLEKLMATMQSDPRASLVYAGAEQIGADGQVTGLVPEAALYETNVENIVRAAQIVMSLYTYSMPLYGLMRTSALGKCRLKPYNYGNDHIIVCEMALYGNLRCVREPLFKVRNGPTFGNWSESVGWLAASQVEEKDRCVDPASGFFPLEQHLPFVHMACGHIEMFSKAQIPHHLKEPLCGLARNVFRQRFAPFIKVELQKYEERLSEILSSLQSGQTTFGPVEKSYFLRRTLSELNRATLFLPHSEILRQQRRTIISAIENE